MTARLHAFFKYDENLVMVRPVFPPCPHVSGLNVSTLASISTFASVFRRFILCEMVFYPFDL